MGEDIRTLEKALKTIKTIAYEYDEWASDEIVDNLYKAISGMEDAINEMEVVEQLAEDADLAEKYRYEWR